MTWPVVYSVWPQVIRFRGATARITSWPLATATSESQMACTDQSTQFLRRPTPSCASCSTRFSGSSRTSTCTSEEMKFHLTAGKQQRLTGIVSNQILMHCSTYMTCFTSWTMSYYVLPYGGPSPAMFYHMDEVLPCFIIRMRSWYVLPYGWWCSTTFYHMDEGLLFISIFNV